MMTTICKKSQNTIMNKSNLPVKNKNYIKKVKIKTFNRTRVRVIYTP